MPRDSLEIAWSKEKPVEIITTMQDCFNRDGVGSPVGWINDEVARHVTADKLIIPLPLHLLRMHERQTAVSISRLAVFWLSNDPILFTFIANP